jgi:hypothetical protein
MITLRQIRKKGKRTTGERNDKERDSYKRLKERERNIEERVRKRQKEGGIDRLSERD